MKQLIMLMFLVAVVGCTSRETTDQPNLKAEAPSKSEIELKSDLTASDFKTVMIGRWASVFSGMAKQNVQELECKPDGSESLVITRDGESTPYSGSYTITFDRPPAPGSDTHATITINPQGSEPIILSRVHFGLCNAVHMKEGLLLLISKEPGGVLKKTTRHSTLLSRSRAKA